MKICLNKVLVNKKDILYRMLQYSLYEESLFDLNEMNENALFEYKDFDLYFEDEDKVAYFIMENDTKKILGFIMISKNINIYNINEFMILPKYRKIGIGKKAAFMIFNMYKGCYQVSPSYGSSAAYDFWKNVIGEYTNNDYQYKDGMFMFNN